MFLKDNLKEVLDEPLAKARLKEVAEPFSLQSLIAWLETKDADAEYAYVDFDNCLVAQYARQVPGVEKPAWRTWYGFGSDNISNDIRATISVPRPWTFGAALQRALILQANGVSGS